MSLIAANLATATELPARRLVTTRIVDDVVEMGSSEYLFPNPMYTVRIFAQLISQLILQAA